MSVAERQLALDLPHRPALAREDFLVTSANAMAVAWIDQWPRWGQPALLLHGPAGSGKTHLASVWQRLSGAVLAEPDALLECDPPELLKDAPGAVIDDLDRLLEAIPEPEEVERRVFHLYNVLRERSGHLLVTGRAFPRQWPLTLPDLRSRLAAAPAAEIGAPDDRLIEAVLVKLFADRQLRVAPEVIRFLLARMERSFAAVRALVAALDRASLAERRDITIPLARRVLEELQGYQDNDRQEGS